MRMRTLSRLLATTPVLPLAVACATSSSGPVAQIEKELQAQSERVQTLETELATRDQRIETLERDLESSKLPPVSAPGPMAGALFPPAAKAGECYARVFVPAEYRSESERVLKREATHRIEVIPARYEWVEESVLVKEASQKLEVVPATHEWVEERVVVEPAQTVWKKGRGPIERIDHATGEILCLVEEPARYETIRKRVLKTPATTRSIEIPARYETVKVRKLVQSAQEKKVELPAEYGTITKRTMVREGRMDWRPVLCETNLDRGLVTSLQRALRDQGHDPGAIDGVIGARTLGAVRAYQKQKGLPSGGLTLATLDSLGVKVSR